MLIMTVQADSPFAFTHRERRKDKAWIRMFCVEAWIEQQHKCAYCHEPIGRDEATADHVVSISKGGSTKRKNIKAACRDCNLTKGHMSEAVFLKAIKSPQSGMSLHIWLAWSRRRIWLRTERACKRIERMVT
jgi:HNH endonuclease